MGKNSEKKGGKIKVFLCGTLCGATILMASSNYIFLKDKEEVRNSKFKMPEFENSFNSKKEAEEYSFSYYGDKQTYYGDNVRVHVFEDGENKVVMGDKTAVEVDNYNYLSNGYISEKEFILYKTLENKDDFNYFKNEYDVYLFFELMRDVYNEYLNRESFEGLEERKNILYTNITDYIADDSKYTLGTLKFSELSPSVQKDIIMIYEQITSLHSNKEVQSVNMMEQFLEKQEKILRYEILKRVKNKLGYR